MPTFLVGADVQSGRFIHILSEVQTKAVEISAIYPERRLLDASVRQFIDLLVAGLRL